MRYLTKRNSNTADAFQISSISPLMLSIYILIISESKPWIHYMYMLPLPTSQSYLNQCCQYSVCCQCSKISPILWSSEQEAKSFPEMTSKVARLIPAYSLGCLSNPFLYLQHRTLELEWDCQHITISLCIYRNLVSQTNKSKLLTKYKYVHYIYKQI